MALSAEEKRRRAERHCAFIDEQVKVLNVELTLPARNEREFQWWRKDLLRKYAATDDALLERRFIELREAIRPETWEIRHRMCRVQAKDETEWRAVCEAVIIEYLLGLYPPGGEE